MGLLRFAILRDDTHLDLRAGHILALDLKTLTAETHGKPVVPNLGYLAGLLGDGCLLHLADADISRLASQPTAPIREIA